MRSFVFRRVLPSFAVPSCRRDATDVRKRERALKIAPKNRSLLENGVAPSRVDRVFMDSVRDERPTPFTGFFYLVFFFSLNISERTAAGVGVGERVPGILISLPKRCAE